MKKFLGAPCRTPYALHAAFRGDLHGEQCRLHPFLTSHHLRHRHRDGHEESSNGQVS